MSHGTRACAGPPAPRPTSPEEDPPGLPGHYPGPHSTVSPCQENRTMSDPAGPRGEQNLSFHRQETETLEREPQPRHIPPGGITSSACPQGVPTASTLCFPPPPKTFSLFIPALLTRRLCAESTAGEEEGQCSLSAPLSLAVIIPERQTLTVDVMMMRPHGQHRACTV